MKTIVSNVVRDGGKITVFAQFEFPDGEFTADEAQSIVQGFKAPFKTVAKVTLSPIQAGINHQLGVSDAVFAKYSAKP